MQPSKLMRLLSSNEEDANILSSPSEHADRAGWSPFLGTHSRLGELLGVEPGRRHLCWLERVRWEFVPFSPPPLLLCFLPAERLARLLGTSPQRLKLFRPDHSPTPDTPLSLPSPLLTTSEFTTSGTVCAFDSPALAFLPLKQALRLGAGTASHSSCLKSTSGSPCRHYLSLPRASSVAFNFSCFQKFLLSLEVSLRPFRH